MPESTCESFQFSSDLKANNIFQKNTRNLKNVLSIIEVTSKMKKTVPKTILTKFAKLQTALMTSVNSDTPILVNLVSDVSSM